MGTILSPGTDAASRWIASGVAAALVFFLSLAGCAAPSASATSAAPQPQGWKALLIAGDDQEPAFDNAVDGMAARLEAFAVPRSNIAILKATASGRRAATIDNIRAAFAALQPAPSDGCFVFVTSHGAPRSGLVLKRDEGFLAPRGASGSLLAGACGTHPTVVIASGCFSGSFAEGKSMPAPNRVILTAARDDRPSFGCNAAPQVHGLRWLRSRQSPARRRLERCDGSGSRVRCRQRAGARDRSPSGPQLSIGPGAGKLRAFPG